MALRFFILGAGGFLGRSIVRFFADQPDIAEVVAHVRSADGPTPTMAGNEWHALDLQRCNTAAFMELLDRAAPDVVVNCTGLTTGPPERLRSANVDVVDRLIDALDGRTRVHLVHLGSAAEYGIQHSGGPVSEDVFATPGSAYGVTKLEATEHLMAAARERRITATVLRVFNPMGRYSPETTLPGSAARQIDAALRNRSDAVHLGSLDSWSDYIDTRDVARAVHSASTMAPRSGVVLNVGRGVAVHSRELVSTLASIAGFDGEIVETGDGSTRSSPVTWNCADVRAIEAKLGWWAQHSIEDSLRALWCEVRERTTA